MKKGYYWIRFRGECEKIIGYYEGKTCKDGSKNDYPWQIVGSDDIFKEDEIEMLIEVK